MQKLPKEYSASHDVLIFFTCLSRSTGLPVDDLRHPDTSLYDTFFPACVADDGWPFMRRLGCLLGK